MDKINLTHWNRIFGNTRQELQFASGHYTDVQLSFNEPGLAEGSIRHVAAPGMQLIELSLKAGKPFQLVEEDLTEGAESVFVLDGAAESRFQNVPTTVALKKNNHNLQYNPAFGGEHVITSPTFRAITISYDLEFLKRLTQTAEDRSIAQLANSLEQKKTWMATSNAMNCQPQIAGIITTIRQCSFSGVTRYIFLESKMLELFALQMEQAKANVDDKQKEWSSADRDRLYAVKEFIDSSYLEEFSLKDLTYKFGLNEFKLKKGYKDLFSSTVFGHVHQLRMQKAKALLSEKEMNVTEAAYFVGYNNVSSFCTEFKKRFGYSPGKIQLN
jgi:AraC family transcriptional regulator, transcriptional activator of the genes for pyochelin and ferripyochelin receptors